MIAFPGAPGCANCGMGADGRVGGGAAATIVVFAATPLEGGALALFAAPPIDGARLGTAAIERVFAPPGNS